MTTTPAARPRAPYFSSGPCAKRPGWSLDNLDTSALGRSHRAKLGKGRLKLAIDLTREVLGVPDTHRIGIVPASDTGAVEITSQNHGFAVDEDSLPAELEITHRSLNDGTIEGLRHRELPLFCVQYHPEASAGPHDSHYLFERFADLMDEHRP